MSVIDDLLAEVPESVRSRLMVEVNRLREPSRFGLQFERHIPEYLAIPGTRLRKGSRIAVHGEPLSDTFLVSRQSGRMATVVREANGDTVEFPYSKIVSVKKIGEAVFPALQYVESIERNPGQSQHVLIEGENHSVLELLDWTTQGRVDCIYIDPPYNTGTTSWLYNNKIVDKDDAYRSSKWLSMMERRLRLAKQLLKKDGVLIIAIDDHEYANLRVLLSSERLFKGWTIDVVVVQHNPRGGGGNHVSSTHEYAIFVVPPGRKLFPIAKSTDELRDYRRRGRGDNNSRAGRPNSFFAIHLDPLTKEVVGVGPALGPSEPYDAGPTPEGYLRVYPLGREQKVGGRVERVWRNTRLVVAEKLLDGSLKLRCTPRGTIVQVIAGERKSAPIRSIWTDRCYNAGEQGTNLVQALTGVQFPYPKSIYTVLDCLKAVVGERREAVVLDFFGGSGTTMHATELLNVMDGGARRCILVTNNEVNGEISHALREAGYRPGDEEWEAKGICRSVTYPRLKAAILGARADGSPVDWRINLGETAIVEEEAEVVVLPFIGADRAVMPDTRKGLAAFLGVAAKALKDAWPYYIAPKDRCRDPRRGQAVLLDPDALQAFLQALGEADDITRVLLVSTGNPAVDGRMRAAVRETLGPQMREKSILRNTSHGLRANLSYLRITYLDPDAVEVKQCLHDLLPTLWLMSGASGQVPIDAGAAEFLIPEGARFALLAEPSAFPRFRAALTERPDVDWVFLVEDSPEGFLEMSRRLPIHIPTEQRVRLYRSYLDNFQINAGDS